MSTIKFCCSFSIAVLLTTQANARRLPDWEFSRLLAASDVVAIVKLDNDQSLNDEQLDKVAVTRHLAKLRVESALKGGARDSISVKYYQNDTKGLMIGTVNGPCFASFGRDDRYLIFLKKDASGDLVPTSGQYDSALSVFEIRQQIENK